ncbi:Kelch domain-containing protein 2 [Apophysomyces ossiformis]|uniref:Kelch domain-containing protein 2 n=1 Tax=Apophysomyces ossiformis TaxID=679940 RepID=A0A8H7BTX6_9FUNG|nr:Kelch domain-containing protein 2 [Apophysomyces ossiformis]
MAMCQYDTKTSGWRRIWTPNAPLARRNAAADVTSTGEIMFWGGNSDTLTGSSEFAWQNTVVAWDPLNTWIGPSANYSGPLRSNATITQIRDTNGQLVIIGGTAVPDPSVDDEVTNVPLANMSDIILYDPRTGRWANVVATGNIPTKRKHHTTILHPDGHTLIVFGGEGWNDTSLYLLNDVALLDTRNWVWSTPAITGTALYRSNHTSILIDQKMWVLAGTNTTAKAVDIQILDLGTWSWTFNAQGNRPPLYAVGGPGGLAGIVIGSVIFLAALIAGIILWYRRRKRDNDSVETFENQSFHSRWLKSSPQPLPSESTASSSWPMPRTSYGFSSVTSPQPSPISPYMSTPSQHHYVFNDGAPHYDYSTSW